MTVVWAEDAEGDRFLIRSALDGVADAPGIRFASDGALAIEAVRRRRPRLVVLDINMPNVDGIEALRRLRLQPNLKELPIVMFSTARNESEVAACETLGISAFVQKPAAYEKFAIAVRAIVQMAK